MNPGGWSTNRSVAAGWWTTVALQVDGGDERSTEGSLLHNEGVQGWLAVANLWHVVLTKSPKLSLGNYPTQQCYGVKWRTRVEKT